MEDERPGMAAFPRWRARPWEAVEGMGARFETIERKTTSTAGLLGLIEVGVTSHEFDRAKPRAYAGVGVKESWLVLAPEKQIEVQRQSTGGQFAQRVVHGPGGRMIRFGVPGLTVDLTTLFAV